MLWPAPQYSKSQINRAGEILAAEDAADAELSRAHEVLSNWRACHGYPMNTFQPTLRNKLKKIGQVGAIVAQRLKRTPSIIEKLRRFDTMRLARMQDIGGLRAVVPKISDVRSLRDEYARSKFKHPASR
jgi:ppGpp synthetase/RelA/SpoT-type nucleotidyltranferase